MRRRSRRRRMDTIINIPYLYLCTTTTSIPRYYRATSTTADTICTARANPKTIPSSSLITFIVHAPKDATTTRARAINIRITPILW
jgi:hypothetical protein